MTAPVAVGRDIPTRKVVIGLVVLALGTAVYFASIKPAVREHTLDVRAERRAACVAVPEATTRTIVAGLRDLDGRRVRSVRAMPSTDGWRMVSIDIAEPDVPGGFTGDLLTWRVRDGGGDLVIESVDRNARELSSFPAATDGVDVATEGGFDSRWCAKNAALSP
jgi:hypothetical protein